MVESFYWGLSKDVSGIILACFVEHHHTFIYKYRAKLSRLTKWRILLF